uniref:PDZ domain-containing protein n=1 Tax=Alexandrium andersonii TaxID=327968 RepID=A0A7S2C0H4_9DINO|mmetsp:Transcript_32609/g.74240  ORF Transcript_32609/g.74240 Transcript_32609/m.74240 type:complete len:220 (+) Transcript_32609:2-661(+)
MNRDMQDARIMPPLLPLEGFDDAPFHKPLLAPPSRTISTCTWDRSLADLGTCTASFDGVAPPDVASMDSQVLDLDLSQPEEFSVFLTKHGQTLGVSLSYGRHDDFLLVTKIGDGLVQQLNDSGLVDIRVFDAIVQVNGFRGDATEMLERLSKADSLELVLARYVGEEQLDGILSGQPGAGANGHLAAALVPPSILPRMFSEQYGSLEEQSPVPRMLSEQ